MATQRKLLSGSTGLNTTDDRVRIDYDWRTGVSDLAVALNVTIAPSGRINRRRGKTLKKSISNPHSLFCDGGEALFVASSTLYLLGTDFNYRSLASLTSNDYMAYAQVKNRIYYTNDTDLGYVEDGVAYAWEKSTDYVGVTKQRILSGPFAGNHLGWHGGRMYIAKDKALWWSEYMAVDWYDMARNFVQFMSPIRMIKPVKGGMYVSDCKEIFFLKGLVPHQFEKDTVANYPALEWSDAIGYVDGSNFTNLNLDGPCAMWITREGAMVGSPEGRVVNLNKKKVVYPEGTRGRSVIRGLNFIHTIE